jgi:hypothetical protein
MVSSALVAPPELPPLADVATAQALNSNCFCIGLDEAALRAALEAELGQPGLFELVQQRCPHIFSAQPVFVAHRHLQRMADLVRAVESVVSLPAWRDTVLAKAPAIARHDPDGARSVFFGYDFHLSGDRLSLIEINTNAGGALLNAVLSRAQRACCPAIGPLVPGVASAEALEQRIVDMFRKEWRRTDRPLHRIAIVDDAPQDQYLYPEFLLFQRLFERHGLQAVVASPSGLHWRDGALHHETGVIDLVYNRLTDFYLEGADSAAIRDAYVNGAVVVTPHPQAHALYADKGNLALLSDGAALQVLGVDPAVQGVLLSDIPRTQTVTPENADRLWSERRGLFFKPRAGFGSRAAYRGDKLTKRVWNDILAGDYVAQALAVPSQRVIETGQSRETLKFDLRAYVYDGDIQWVAARLYQGQTTNFRTPGGGFAPVYSASPLSSDAGGCSPSARWQCSDASSSPTASCG